MATPKKKIHKAQPTISLGMHYTVVIALMISVITTLLLGMLLSYTMLGLPLNYFASIAEEGKIVRQAKMQVLRVNKMPAKIPAYQAIKPIDLPKPPCTGPECCFERNTSCLTSCGEQPSCTSQSLSCGKVLTAWNTCSSSCASSFNQCIGMLDSGNTLDTNRTGDTEL